MISYISLDTYSSNVLADIGHGNSAERHKYNRPHWDGNNLGIRKSSFNETILMVRMCLLGLIYKQDDTKLTCFLRKFEDQYGVCRSYIVAQLPRNCSNTTAFLQIPFYSLSEPLFHRRGSKASVVSAGLTARGPWPAVTTAALEPRAHTGV